MGKSGRVISPREGGSGSLDGGVEGNVDEEEIDDENLWNFELIRVKLGLGLGLGFRIGRLRRMVWGLD